MIETIELTRNLHIFFIAILLVIAAINLNLIFLKLEKEKYITYINNTFPIYYTILLIVFFTGIFALVFSGLSFSIVVMIIVWIWFLISSIISYRKFKNMRKDFAFKENFIQFSIKKNIIDIIIIFVFLFITGI